MEHDAITTRLTVKGQEVFDALVLKYGLEALLEAYNLPRFCSPSDIVEQAILWGNIDGNGVMK